MHERLQPSRKALRYVAEKLTQFVQHPLKTFEWLVRIDVAHCWQSGGHLGPMKVRVCEALGRPLKRESRAIARKRKTT